MLKSMKLFVISCCIPIQSHAFVCYVTMVKDNCWTNYNLTVDVTDASSSAVATTIVVPAGQSWGRKQFACNAGQTLALSAQFSPVFWRTDVNKVFPAQRFWRLPDNIESGITGWNVTVCYPKWFADVPMPPGASVNCACNTDNIPPIAPQAKSM